jgi:hypothetical protein
MEHSEEYYKMKYFKYKAKYIAELERQKGGFFNLLLHVDAKNSAIRNAWLFYKKIKGTNFNEDAELAEWKKMTKFDQLFDKIYDLGFKKDESGKGEVQKYIDKNETKETDDKVIKEFNSVTSSLSQWCKNILPRNSIDKNCINDKLKEIVNKIDETPVNKKNKK